MLRFRFLIDFYEGDVLVKENFVTDVHEFPDVTALANSIISCASYATRGHHVVQPPGAQNIQLISLESGYSVDTVHIIKEAIPA